jgi:hypothetical protein
LPERRGWKCCTSRDQGERGAKGSLINKRQAHAWLRTERIQMTRYILIMRRNGVRDGNSDHLITVSPALSFLIFSPLRSFPSYFLIPLLPKYNDNNNNTYMPINITL